MRPIASHDRMNGKNFVVKSPPHLKMVSSLKRKFRSGLNSSKTRKRAKTGSGPLATIDALPWKTLSHTGGFENNGDDGILELEQVDNVQVVYQETTEGRVATFRVRCSRYGAGAYPHDVQILDVPQMATSSRLPEDDAADAPDISNKSDEDEEEASPQNCSTRGLLPQWDIFELHDQLLRALHRQSFTEPTPIQSKAIPPALRGKDIVGVAETVCTHLPSLPTNTHIGTGIGKNFGVWITNPTQAPLTEEMSGVKIP